MITLAPIPLRWQPAERIDLRPVPHGLLLVANAERQLAVANQVLLDIDGQLHAWLTVPGQTDDYVLPGVEQMARLDGVFGQPLTREQEAQEIAGGRC